MSESICEGLFNDFGVSDSENSVFERIETLKTSRNSQIEKLSDTSALVAAYYTLSFEVFLHNAFFHATCLATLIREDVI